MREIKLIFKNKVYFLPCKYLLALLLAALCSGLGFQAEAAQNLVTAHFNAQGRVVTLTMNIAKDSQITSGRIKIRYPQELLGTAQLEGGNLWELCDVNTELTEGGQGVMYFAWADVEKCTEEGTIFTAAWEAQDAANGKYIAVEAEIVELYSREKRILSNENLIIDRIYMSFPGIGGHTGGAARTGDEANVAGLALLCLGAVLVMVRLLRTKIKE